MNALQAHTCAMAGKQVRRSGWTAGNFIKWDGVDIVDQAAVHATMSTADWAATDWERYEAVENNFDWALGEWAAGNSAGRKAWATPYLGNEPVMSITVADKDATDWVS